MRLRRQEDEGGVPTKVVAKAGAGGCRSVPWAGSGGWGAVGADGSGGGDAMRLQGKVHPDQWNLWSTYSVEHRHPALDCGRPKADNFKNGVGRRDNAHWRVTTAKNVGGNHHSNCTSSRV